MARRLGYLIPVLLSAAALALPSASASAAPAAGGGGPTAGDGPLVAVSAAPAVHQEGDTSLSATPGYDDQTGLGSPDGAAYVAVLSHAR